jgi:hypothetical protein
MLMIIINRGLWNKNKEKRKEKREKGEEKLDNEFKKKT